MAQTFEAVPESLTREQFLGFIKQFGFDPKGILNMRLDSEGVRVEAFVLAEDGTKQRNADGTIAKATIDIPIVN